MLSCLELAEASCPTAWKVFISEGHCCFNELLRTVFWYRDAVDREKSGQIEDLTRKLQHAHLTAEQYRGQAEAANKRLTQAEEAKKAREAELANLRLEVQTQVDKRCFHASNSSDLYPAISVGC